MLLFVPYAFRSWSGRILLRLAHAGCVSARIKILFWLLKLFRIYNDDFSHNGTDQSLRFPYTVLRSIGLLPAPCCCVAVPAHIRLLTWIIIIILVNCHLSRSICMKYSCAFQNSRIQCQMLIVQLNWELCGIQIRMFTCKAGIRRSGAFNLIIRSTTTGIRHL